MWQTYLPFLLLFISLEKLDKTLRQASYVLEKVEINLITSKISDLKNSLKLIKVCDTLLA